MNADHHRTTAIYNGNFASRHLTLHGVKCTQCNPRKAISLSDQSTQDYLVSRTQWPLSSRLLVSDYWSLFGGNHQRIRSSCSLERRICSSLQNAPLVAIDSGVYWNRFFGLSSIFETQHLEQPGSVSQLVGELRAKWQHLFWFQNFWMLVEGAIVHPRWPFNTLLNGRSIWLF